MGDTIPASEAARRLGIRPHTLAVWRLRGIGPRYARYGHPTRGRCYYSADDVATYVVERTHTSTAAETMAAASAGARS